MEIGCVLIFLANIFHLLDGLKLPIEGVRAYGDSLVFHWKPNFSSIFLRAALVSDECEVNKYAYITNPTALDHFSTNLNFKKNIKTGDKVRVELLVMNKEHIETQNAVLTISYLPFGIDVTPNIPCKPTQKETQTEGPSKTCDKLIFEDNFNNNQKLTDKWVHEVMYRNFAPYYEFVAFDSDAINSYISDNKLHITMTDGIKKGRVYLDKCTSRLTNKNAEYQCGSKKTPVFTKPYTKKSANLYSKFSFKYGRIEIGVQMPRGDWIFPNILLEPNIKNNRNNGFSKDQIRLYSRGNEVLQNENYIFFDGRSVFGSVVVWHDTNFSEYWTVRENKDELYYYDAPYNYTIIWQKDIISFMVNGLHFGDITNKTLLERFNEHECRIVLGLTAGGVINFDNEVLLKQDMKKKNYFLGTNLPNSENNFIEKYKDTEKTPLIVDYIRVYKLDNC